MDLSGWTQVIVGAGAVAGVFVSIVKYQSNLDKIDRLREDNTRLEKEKDELKGENRELHRKIDQKNEAILNHLK